MVKGLTHKTNQSHKHTHAHTQYLPSHSISLVIKKVILVSSLASVGGQISALQPSMHKSAGTSLLCTHFPIWYM